MYENWIKIHSVCPQCQGEIQCFGMGSIQCYVWTDTYCFDERSSPMSLN